MVVFLFKVKDLSVLIGSRSSDSIVPANVILLIWLKIDMIYEDSWTLFSLSAKIKTEIQGEIREFLKLFGLTVFAQRRMFSEVLQSFFIFIFLVG